MKNKGVKMTATTYFRKHENAFLARLVAGAKSLGAQYVAARQAQAQKFVNAHLATFDDNTLARLRIDRETIKKMQKGFYADH